MKKLMTVITALATGLVAWTGGAVTASALSKFDASSVTVATYSEGWSGVVTNIGKVSFVAGEAASGNYLKLETGTELLARSIDGYTMGGEGRQANLYFDVSLDLLGQVQDTVPAVSSLGESPKLALFFLDTTEQEGIKIDELKGTNLFAIAKSPKGTGYVLLAYHWETAKELLDGTKRLTIQAYANVLESGTVCPGFVLYVNGDSSSAKVDPMKVAYVVPYDEHNTAPDWKSAYEVNSMNYLSGMVASTLSEKVDCLALSMIDGNAGKTLTSFDFAGNANISTVTIQDTKFDFIADDVAKTKIEYTAGDVTLAFSDGMTNGEGVVIAGGTITATVTADKPILKLFIGQTEQTLAKGTEDNTWTYAYTYEAGQTLTFTAYAVAATATIDDVATQYASLEEALAAITEAGASSAKIELAADATIGNIEFENSTEIVLDLMGKTITGTNTSGIDAIIAPNGKFTLTDSSELKTGRIVVDENATIGDGFDSVAAISLMNEGNVLIEAGIIDGAVLVSSDYPSTFSISGGKFLASANTAEQEGEGEGTDEEVTEADANAETDTPTDTTETTAEPTFALADYVAEGKKAELNEAKDYWVIVDDSTPVAKTWVDYLGEADTEDGAYKIDTEDDLLALQANAKTLGTSNITFKLTADIALTKEWTGVGLDKGDVYSFDGTFDGNGKTISNVVFADLSELEDGNNYRGFFGKVGSTGVIKNLTVSGTGFGATPPSGEYGCAMIVGELLGTLENCTAEGTIANGTHNVGGVCVRLTGGTIKGCTNKVNVTGNYTKVGGICVISQQDGGTIAGCVNEGSVTAVGDSTYVNAGRDGIGGIIGYVAPAKTVTIRNCTNKGVISKGEGANACNAVGQIVGFYLSGTLMLEGTNKVLPGYSTIGVTANTSDDAYKGGNVSGLNYAALPAVDDLVTLVKDDALAAGTTYKVMAHGRTYTLATAESTVTFDESLNTVTVALDDTLTNAYEIAKAVVGEATDKVTTYSVAAKSAAIVVTPGEIEKTTYSSESEADAEVKKINDAIAKDSSIVVAPESLSDADKTTYRKLFAAKAVANGGTYQVKIDFTDEATTNLQTQVDGDVKIVELQTLASLAEDAEQAATITTTPGLYYTVYAGTDVTALNPATCKQATGATMEIKFPNKGTRGFYKVGVSITSTLLQNQQ